MSSSYNEFKKEKKDAPKKDAPKKKTKVQIDNLALRIDKVILKEYTEDGEVKIKEFNINLNVNFNSFIILKNK